MDITSLIEAFGKFYWLKPADVVWDSVNALYVNQFLDLQEGDQVLDLGAGDGVNTALMLGGGFMTITIALSLRSRSSNVLAMGNLVISTMIPSKGSRQTTSS